MIFPRRIFFVVFTLPVLFGCFRAVEARDEWVSVRSKNFFLIGNASEKDIRKAGLRLEQFRETFRMLFSDLNLASPIPTNVIVFKNEASYRNFKPKRADGKIDIDIAGSFQSGEDVNYITLSASGDEQQTFTTIFHEYVHFIVDATFGRPEVPAWFNEGLAEYYETFAIDRNQTVRVGLPQDRHLPLLKQNKLIPLRTLFDVSSYQLLQMTGPNRNLFYAESWLLIHYLIQNGKTDALLKFQYALLHGAAVEKSFTEAFKTDYTQMETVLEAYVRRDHYGFQEYNFKSKIVFDTQTQSRVLDEVEVNAYLGDLLYHNNRADEAEPYLAAALKADTESGVANTAMGLVKINQRRFDEAKTFLAKAVAGDTKNYIAYFRYAFLLSREGHDEFGFVQSFDAALCSKIREILKKAIALNPAYTESYEMLAFIDIVNNQDLNEAIKAMQTALEYKPGNQRYSLRLAEIYSRQDRFAEAAELVVNIAKAAENAEVKNRADDLMLQIKERKLAIERNAEERRGRSTASTGENGVQLPTRRIEGVPKPSDEDIAKAQADTAMRTMNSALRPLGNGDQRVIGQIVKIDCKKRPIGFAVKTQADTFALSSTDFSEIYLRTFDGKMANVAVGCDANLSEGRALITYRPAPALKSGVRGSLVAIEFVPPNFRIMADDEMRAGTLVIYDQPVTGKPNDEIIYIDNVAVSLSQRRASMIQAIGDALRKPDERQKRETGFLDKIECTDKGSIFFMRTESRTLRLINTSLPKLNVRYFTPDLAETQFSCGIRPVEFPAIFIYSDTPDNKTKTAGEIVSIDFVPKSFVLSPGN